MRRITLIGIIALVAVSAGVAIPIIANSVNSGDSSSSSIEDDKNKDHLVFGSNTKKDYYIGEDFVAPNVFLIYKDGTNKDVSNSPGLVFSGYDMNTAGVYVVNANYKESGLNLSADYSIVVYNAKLESLSVKYPDTELVWGEKIDRNKLVVTANYSNSRRETVTDYQLRYDSKPEEYGPIDVTVMYKDVTKVFQITVVEKPLDKKYEELENEAIKLLIRFGVSNPSSPRDYQFDIDTKSNPRIKFSGVLDGELKTTEQQYAYLMTVIFYDYQLVGEIVDSTEMIFPSKKAVFANSENDYQTTIYVTSLMGEIRYSIIIQ